MDCIPTEVLENILSYLDLSLLATISHVCTRWREVITRRHFHPYLLSQEFSVKKQCLASGWCSDSEDGALTRLLFWRVYKQLEEAWSNANPSTKETVVGVFSPGDVPSHRVTDMVVFKDKLYLAMEGCVVHVHDINDLKHTDTLEGGEGEGGEHLTRSCQLVLHCNTLAVSSPGRDKVRLFNCETDEMVGEIETRLGPIYNLAMNDRLLVCLSGWSCLAWRINSRRPETVRGQFQGMIPDFQPSDQFQNWLEIHAAVVNNTWLVTRATRMRTQVGIGDTRSISFLHVRRVGPDGHIGDPIRPESAAMPENVVEMNSMTLSEDSLLAVLVMVRGDGSVLRGVQQLRYVIQVLDVRTGDMVASLPTESILASVQMPVCWRGEKLFIKIVPKPVGGFYSSEEGDEEDEFQISLANWDIRTNQLTNIPGAQVGSSTDLISVELARLVVVSTKFSHRPLSHLEFDTDLETLAHMEADLNPENGPKFTVKVELYDFWNLAES
eukprot:TRINITY_DN29226_c0_g1_i1.p1 TRINITY_DN29226_c0_g1~~TRINITY_DN29226_c0_g1_i1.p1  ORF type:complete len:496 (+),score=140.44 TRINITY_DN29226_c0_g1_i1:83-1570(+)